MRQLKDMRGRAYNKMQQQADPSGSGQMAGQAMPAPPTSMNPAPGPYSPWGNNPMPVPPPSGQPGAAPMNPLPTPEAPGMGGGGNFSNWRPGASNEYGGQQIAGATPSQADYGSVQQYADAAHQNAMRYLEPQMEQQNRRMAQNLINQGIDPNSEQGKARMDQMGRQQADAQNAAAFGAMQFGQGIQNQMSQQELANQQLAGQMQLGQWNQMGQAANRDLNWGLGQMQNQLGMAGLQNQRDLGIAGIDAQRYGMDLSHQRGMAGLDNQRYGIDMGHQLGMGQLDLGRQGQEFNQMQQMWQNQFDTTNANNAMSVAEMQIMNSLLNSNAPPGWGQVGLGGFYGPERAGQAGGTGWKIGG